MKNFFPFIVFAGIWIFWTSCVNEASMPDQVSFNYDIRPIFSNNCYLCHGNDPESREAGLRLDLESAAKAQLESGKIAIVPFEPDSSELIKRIIHKDPEEIMPPLKTKKILTEQEISLLRRWISQGARWESHWAFQPIAAKTIKSGKHQRNNPIDDYINTACDNHNLKIQAEADQNSLVRRVALLTTGLLPTIAEMKQYADPSSYAAMVDHYLASPAYGERWARHWMDLVRYAEARGHEFDFNIPGAWHYRDYLIKAFNDNVPYDQLIREHLAGDLLSETREDQNHLAQTSIGTAFYTLGEGTHSPVDVKKDEADRIDNMIDVTSKTFLGLTMSCARCHDHKFDPIPTADYYAWYGIMESTRFHYHSMQNQSQVETNLQEINEIDREIKEFLLGHQAQVLPVSQVEEHPGVKKIADFSSGKHDDWFFDGNAFGSGNAKGQILFENHQPIGIHQDKISSRYYGYGLSGAARSPTFEINKDYLQIRAAGHKSSIRIIIDNFQLIRNPIYGNLNQLVESNGWQDITIDVSMWKGHLAYVEVIPAILLGGKKLPDYEWDQDSTSWIEIQSVSQSDEKSTRSPGVNKKLYRQITPDGKNFSQIHSLIDKRDHLLAQIRDTAFYLGVTAGSLVESPIFIRGQHLQMDSILQKHRLLTLLDKPPFRESQSSRLQMANSIASEENPLTARVMVNRIWSHLLGTGIVASVDNFGQLGELPTHPELLDHLAGYLIEHHWSIKETIRYILQSHTFKRKSASEVAEADPTNKWLSHYPIRRIEAEAIRDIMSQLSGKLNQKMYGKPVPVYLNEFMEGRGKPESGPVDGNGRRSIYLSMRRNFLNPFLLAFDMPQPVSTFGKRNQTTVPAQSLTLMNDPYVKLHAKAWATHIIESESRDEERISKLYFSAFCRLPLDTELKQSLNFVSQQTKLHQAHSSEAEAQLGAWEDLCHSIFNMKEFIYIF